MLEQSKQSKRVISIIVTYEPDPVKLSKLITSLQLQVNKIIIVDNNSSNFSSIKRLIKDNNFDCIKLNQNYGIAYAQNQGIVKATQEKLDYILLMDQDSIPETNMVAVLLKGFVNEGVIATGPSYVDSRSGKKSFFVIDKNGFPARIPSTALVKDTIEAAFLISSGTLIDASKLLKIKGKRSEYFIDHVDTEWTIRARTHGYKLLGIPSAIMYHSLGDSVKNVWFFGKRQVSYHSALRDYYMFRNTILVLRDVNMNWWWKLHFIWRLLQFSVYFLTFSSERRDRFNKMALGIWHGIRNVRGKLDLNQSICTTIPRTNLDP